MNPSASILLIEDDAFTGRMLELQFTKHGYQVEHVTDGKKALALIATKPFDLVLSDVMMPGFTGIEVLTEIRKTHSKDQLPVILVTALDNTKRIMEGLNLGANDFLGKTNEFGIILARVELHLEVKRLRLQSSEAAKPNQVGLRSSPDGMWSWLVGKGNLGLSNRWKALLGFGADELSGTDPALWLNRIHPEDAPGVNKLIKAHHERKRPWFEADYRIQHKDGNYLWVHSFGVAVFGKDGKPTRMVGCMCTLAKMGEIKSELVGCAATLKQLSGMTETEKQDTLNAVISRLERLG